MDEYVKESTYHERISALKRGIPQSQNNFEKISLTLTIL